MDRFPRGRAGRETRRNPNTKAAEARRPGRGRGQQRDERRATLVSAKHAKPVRSHVTRPCAGNARCVCVCARASLCGAMKGEGGGAPTHNTSCTYTYTVLHTTCDMLGDPSSRGNHLLGERSRLQQRGTRTRAGIGYWRGPACRLPCPAVPCRAFSPRPCTQSSIDGDGCPARYRYVQRSGPATEQVSGPAPPRVSRLAAPRPAPSRTRLSRARLGPAEIYEPKGKYIIFPFIANRAYQQRVRFSHSRCDKSPVHTAGKLRLNSTATGRDSPDVEDGSVVLEAFPSKWHEHRMRR